jgi:apolipoprotein N-acyltransferase
MRAGILLLSGMVLVSWGNAWRSGDPPPPASSGVVITGVQMEFPAENEVYIRLNSALKKHPETQLLVLSEYTFSGPVPDRIKAWCREHRVHLIVGGQAPIRDTYYNTAFVISPEGEVVFSQAKSVPIQFFKDGLPALKQEVWNSPWGRIGICICYDLSYTRVTDRLARQGAELLIVPTMDVFDWGIGQHRLHARVAPVRAAEYGIPIFRLASSGISQVVDRYGSVLASAPCPGDGAILSGTVELRGGGHLPLDRWLAPACVAVTAAALLWMVASRIRAKTARGL